MRRRSPAAYKVQAEMCTYFNSLGFDPYERSNAPKIMENLKGCWDHLLSKKLVEPSWYKVFVLAADAMFSFHAGRPL